MIKSTFSLTYLFLYFHFFKLTAKQQIYQMLLFNKL